MSLTESGICISGEMLDGSGFFFRLDKQEAYHGRLKLVGSGEDTTEVRLTK